MTWKYFHGNQLNPNPLTKAPECPPWREFAALSDETEAEAQAYWDALPKSNDEQIGEDPSTEHNRATERGRSFRIPPSNQGQAVVDAVNAAIHLRRPLLVTGAPGSGKTSLAYAIAYELSLGPVLSWPITARTNLTDALYQYDAIARLQDAQLDETRKGQLDAEGNPLKDEGDMGDYITLGPVGTAFLPSQLPRVLLIDEIDKSDLNLPNELLNLFEEGDYEIPELIRRKRRQGEADTPVHVRTADQDMPTRSITGGRVKCCEFPIVIMTSNGERDFPPAFYRRCLRIAMPDPTATSLLPVIKAHFKKADRTGWSHVDENLTAIIDEFVGKENKVDRATDQLLNAVFLTTREDSPGDEEMKRLKDLLFKRLSELS